MAHLSDQSQYKCKINTFCTNIDPFTLDITTCVDPIPKTVGYFDIVNYCIENSSEYNWQSFKHYKNLESFKMFQNGMVVQLSCRNITDEASLIIAIVKHAREITEKPLKCWISLLGISGIILSGHCTCMQDLSDVCSHIGAVLFYLESLARTSGSEDDIDNSTMVKESPKPHIFTREQSYPESKVKDEEFECDKCPLTFNRKWNLHRHILTHEQPSQLHEILTNSEPQEGYNLMVQDSSKPQSFIRNVSNSMIKVETFQCDKCLLTFNRKWNLDRHISRHRQPSDLRDMFRRFHRTQKNRYNEENVAEAKDFLCNICANLFSTKASLLQHLKLHGELSTANDNPKKEFSNQERHTILKFLLLKTNGGKLKKGAINQAAKKFSCNRLTISRIWKRAQQSYADGNKSANVDSLKKNCGRKKKDYSENISKIEELSPNNRQSLRAISDAIGVPKTTLHRLIKEGSLSYKEKGFKCFEEVYAVDTDGSSRFSDIIAFDPKSKEAYIIDPTIRYETSNQDQDNEIQEEKKSIYERFSAVESATEEV